MLVKNVTSGQPITASWANSLVDSVNQKQGYTVSTNRVDFTKAKGGFQFANDEAWKVRLTQDRKITLNAGQIYINGILVKPKKAEHSYNQFCSVDGWKENSVQEIGDDGQLPIFYIEMEMPAVVTEQNISEVVANLKVATDGKMPEVENDKNSNEGGTEGDTEEDTEEDAKIKLHIQINDVVEKEIKQLVSGSIYLTQGNTQISHVGGDGIRVTDLVDEETKKPVVKIDLNVSIIGEDGVSVYDTSLHGWDEYEDYKNDPNNPVYDENAGETPQFRLISIRGEGLSLITGDGLKIEEEHVAILEENGKILAVPKDRRIVTLTPMISLVGGDGIEIVDLTNEDDSEPQTQNEEGETPNKEAKPLKFQIKNNFSFVGGDGITIEAKEEEKDNKKIKTIKISGGKEYSFIGLDGITIEEKNEEITDSETGEKKKVTAVSIGGTGGKISFIPEDIPLTIQQFVEQTEEEITDENGKKQKMQIVKIHNGSISLVERDNIKIDFHDERKGIISFGIQGRTISLIGNDGLKITKTTNANDFADTYEITPQKIKIEADNKNVKVTETESENEKKYKIIGREIIMKSGDLVAVSKTETSTTDKMTTEYKIDGYRTKIQPLGSLEVFTYPYGDNISKREQWLSLFAPKVSLIAIDGLRIEREDEPNSQGGGANVNYYIETEKISLIAGDNVRITCEKFDNGMNIVYKISTTGGMSEIEFDPLYFTVTDGTVSLNTTALDEIISEAVNEISVNVSAQGVIEHTASGSATFRTGPASLSLNSTVYDVY